MRSARAIFLHRPHGTGRANNGGPGPGATGASRPLPATGSMGSRVAGSRVHAVCSAEWECTGDAHADNLVDGGPFPIKMLWQQPHGVWLTPMRRSALAHQ